MIFDALGLCQDEEANVGGISGSLPTVLQFGAHSYIKSSQPQQQCEVPCNLASDHTWMQTPSLRCHDGFGTWGGKDC